MIGSSGMPACCIQMFIKLSKGYSRKQLSELRSITCHKGSHKVICHPTQANVPGLNTSQASRYSSYQPHKYKMLRRPEWPVIYWDGLPVRRQSPIQVVTEPSVQQLWR